MSLIDAFVGGIAVGVILVVLSPAFLALGELIAKRIKAQK